MKRGPYKSGVTLIEMLVVLGILAILVTVFQLGATRLKQKNDERAVRGLFAMLDNGLHEYYADLRDFPHGDPNHPLRDRIAAMYAELDRVPGAREVVDALDTKWGRDKRYMIDPNTAHFYDPWGETLDYSYDPNRGDTFPLLRSSGPDRITGTPDDITNR
ncbi:type II secretion system protein [Planctomycetota bacterium]